MDTKLVFIMSLKENSEIAPFFLSILSYIKYSLVQKKKEMLSSISSSLQFNNQDPRKRKLPTTFSRSRWMEPLHKEPTMGKSVREWILAYWPILKRFVEHRQDLVLEEPIRCPSAGRTVWMKLDIRFQKSRLVEDTATITLTDRTEWPSNRLQKRTIPLHSSTIDDLMHLVSWVDGTCYEAGTNPSSF